MKTKFIKIKNFILEHIYLLACVPAILMLIAFAVYLNNHSYLLTSNN